MHAREVAEPGPVGRAGEGGALLVDQAQLQRRGQAELLDDLADQRVGQPRVAELAGGAAVAEHQRGDVPMGMQAAVEEPLRIALLRSRFAQRTAAAGSARLGTGRCRGLQRCPRGQPR